MTDYQTVDAWPALSPVDTLAASTSHEEYIQAIRTLVVSRLGDSGQRDRLLAAKMVYGMGTGTGARGLRTIS